MNKTTDESVIDVAEAAELPRIQRDSGRRTLHRHTAHSGHGILRRYSQRLMLAVALAISLALLLAVIVISEIRIADLTKGNQIAQAELMQAKQTLEKTLPELQQARNEISSFTKGQFPHLRELTPDKVIKLDAGYVKNIMFAALHKNGKTLYEYRLIMENTSDSVVRPDARVLVFDHRGAQIGMGEIADRTDMLPGESRSYSSIVDQFLDEEPRYFYVWTRGKGKIPLK